MKKAMIVIGGLLILFGLVDLIGSFMEFDLWGKIGIELPDMIWKYSSYIEMIVGYLLLQVGMSSSEKE